MKKSILMLMVVGLFAAMPALAAENAKSDSSKECVIRCVAQAESIVEKINRLKTEIESGKNTYSAEELKKLEKQLNETNEMMRSLEKK
jgi:biopolymer transport protein ExbB/TolQ